MTQEALKLALEWIEDAVVVLSHTSSAIQGGIGVEAECVGGCSVKAITAIKEALAQPEPVALRDVIAVNLMRENINNKHRARELAEHFIKLTTPPQRTWVGLTAADRKEIERQSVYVEGAIRMTEAKLKQKNGFAKEKNT
jgi:hypothetical protein